MNRHNSSFVIGIISYSLFVLFLLLHTIQKTVCSKDVTIKTGFRRGRKVNNGYLYSIKQHTTKTIRVTNCFLW